MLQKNVLIVEARRETLEDVKEILEEEFGADVLMSAERSILELLGCKAFDLLIVNVSIHPKAPDEVVNEIEHIGFDNAHWMSTGVEFLRRLRKGEFSQKGTGTDPNVPVVIVHVEVGLDKVDWRACEELANAIVSMPYILNDFVRAITSLLGIE